MSIKLPPIAKSKSVMITGAISILSLVYKAVDAAGNAEFLWQKVGLNQSVAQFLGSPRAIDFMVAVSMITLVLSLLYQANRNLALGAMQSAGVTVRGSQSTDRVVVDVTPEYLGKLCKGLTTVQAQKSVELYIGKWMRVSGTVRNVRANDSLVAVELKTNRGYDITAYFREKTMFDHISVLRLGNQIGVLGEIDSVATYGISLEKCELINAKAAKPE